MTVGAGHLSIGTALYSGALIGGKYTLVHEIGAGSQSRQVTRAAPSHPYNTMRLAPDLSPLLLLLILTPSSVWKATLQEDRHPPEESCRLVAIKVVRKSPVGPKTTAVPPPVGRQAVLQRSIVHPNIVRLFEVVEDEAHVFIVHEFCQGGELFERIGMTFIISIARSQAPSILMAPALLTAHPTFPDDRVPRARRWLS